MKKVLSIMFVVSLFFICIISVRADYKCFYELDMKDKYDDKTFEFGLNITNDDIKIAYSEFDYDEIYSEVIKLDEYIDSEKISDIVEDLDGTCPPEVYGCQMDSTKFLDSSKAIGVIFNPENRQKMGTPYKVDKWQVKGSEYCKTANYEAEKSTAPSAQKLEFECSFYDNYIGENGYLKKNYCKLGDGGCTTDKIVEYKRKKEELVATCRQYLQNGDYWDQCVKKCITLPDDIASIEGKKATNPCGFSGKLFYWIQNIMKWIKYILPVIVIIFGILDFIKAMANESDEEMKKSQKRFVIRLISAALVFLVPLIIQFVLEKMGFNANACGLW